MCYCCCMHNKKVTGPDPLTNLCQTTINTETVQKRTIDREHSERGPSKQENPRNWNLDAETSETADRSEQNGPKRWRDAELIVVIKRERGRCKVKVSKRTTTTQHNHSEEKKTKNEPKTRSGPIQYGPAQSSLIRKDAEHPLYCLVIIVLKLSQLHKKEPGIRKLHPINQPTSQSKARKEKGAVSLPEPLPPSASSGKQQQLFSRIFCQRTA